jgi:hypothetical protein
LLGEKLNDDSVLKHDGIEIIASNDTDGHVRHALYYAISGSDPPHVACSSLLSDKPENSAHASYPVFGDGIGGLIGIAVASALKHHSNEVHTKHDDIEMVANDGANIKRSYACNLGLGDESCGISGLGSETSSPLGFCGSVVTESLAERVLDTSKNVLSGADYNLAANDTVRETNCFTGATSLYHASLHVDPPALSFSTTSKEKELALLLSAFQALPREDLLIVLEAATSAVTMTLNNKRGASLHMCTDCCSSPPLVMT